MNIQEDELGRLHDLIDDFDQSMYDNNVKEAKEFKEEIEKTLKKYIGRIQ